MTTEKVREYLSKFGLADRVMEFDVSSATVILAAEAIGCDDDRIAKTMAFNVNDEAVLVVMSGMSRIDNRKFKDTFKTKASMISPDTLEEKVGHPMGGVCPFAIKENVKVYLDSSLYKYDIVYPAAGTDNSAVKISVDELEKVISNFSGTVEISKSAEVTANG